MNACIEELGRTAELLRLEKDEEIQTYQRLLKEVSVKERKASGVCWSPVRIVEQSFSFGANLRLTLERNPGDKEAHRFQSGTPVLLFDPADHNKFEKAVVIKVDEKKMIVQLYGDELADWLDEINPGVQIGFDSRSYQEMEFALNRLINAERNQLAHLRDVILGEKEAIFSSEETLVQISTLNNSQNEAINKIINAQEVALVHGPPGTGKTTTLVAAVAELCKNEDRILVCAPSNAAVDHLSRKLHLAGIKVLRIGHSARIGEDISALSLEEKVRSSREYTEVKDLKRKAQEFRNEAGKFKRSFGASERARRKELYQESRALIKDAQSIEEYVIQKCIDEAQAITCTLVGSSSQELRDIIFGTVIIDEAGQALEPMCWIPILKAKRVVMAGDPYQLPPVVKNTAAVKGGLETTLMEKCLDRTKASVMLNVQYRMNEAIMGFSNEWFYRGHLSAHESVAHHLLSNAECALEFVDTAGCGFNELRPDDATSIRNEGEASVLVVHYRELTEALGFQPDTGIISPYREQVRLLREKLNESEAPMIQSVDAFQGQERDLIYVSLVRSNEEGEIGFLKDYRRTNVAMTRARKKLVIIGDSATLANDPFYEAMLKYMEKYGQYRSAWEWMDRL